MNIARRSTFSLGLVSIFEDGRTQVRVGGDSSGFVGASVVYGSGVLHNIYGGDQSLGGIAAVAWFWARPACERGRVHVDFDALGHVLVATNEMTTPDGIAEARVLVGIRVFGPVGFYASAGYRLLISEGVRRSYGPYETLFQPAAAADQIQVAGWPTLSAGLQLF